MSHIIPQSREGMSGQAQAGAAHTHSICLQGGGTGYGCHPQPWGN